MEATAAALVAYIITDMAAAIESANRPDLALAAGQAIMDSTEEESAWVLIPEGILFKVLQLLEADELPVPQDGGWRGCKASSTIRLVCSAWKMRHDGRVRRLVVCKPATDEGMRMLVRGFTAAASLQFKHVAGNALTDQHVRVVSGLPALTALDLTYCSKLTDDGVRTVSKLPALTSLNLACCHKLTDEGVAAVSRLPALTSLNLACCSKVTDEGLRAVSSLTALTFLNLRGDPNVTTNCKQMLRAAIPKLTIDENP
jgi:hypothetical protein